MKHKCRGLNYCQLCGKAIPAIPNPYRLGQRRVYPVKTKRAARYKGALESRRKTYSTKRQAVIASNPGGYLGNTRAVIYKRFPGHKCSKKCAKAGHLYIHKFPANEKTPLRFPNPKKLTIG